MIARSAPGVHTDNQQTMPETWQKELANCITQPDELLEILGLDPSLLPAALSASKDFSMRIPRPYIARMERSNPDDPLLRQVLPLAEETEEVEGFSLDPLAEQTSNPTEAVIHKYQGRLLLVTSSACAVNCRYCFRRHFPYADNRLGGHYFDKALNYIRNDSSIREVILSGGDPLASSDNRLKKLAQELTDIPHLTTLRIHTRMPVVIPSRICDELLDWFCTTRLKPVMVIHCNHANEIDDQVRTVLLRLKKAGVTMLNQSVLLKGINDSVDSLEALSNKLFDAGVMPYYLHLLDKVQGAAHFDIPNNEGQRLVKELMLRCPGYLVPKLIREVAGEGSKRNLSIASH